MKQSYVNGSRSYTNLSQSYVNGSRSYTNPSQSYVDDGGSYIGGTLTFITYVEASLMEEKATRVIEKDSSLEWRDSFGFLGLFRPMTSPIPASLE